MYTAYVDDELFYAPNLAKDGYIILSGVISTELNKAGDFKFKLPPVNPKYDDMTILSSVITVFDENTEIFRGRILEVKRDFQNNKDILCEGVLAYLVDSIVRPYDFTGGVQAYLRKLVFDHNAMVSSSHQFALGRVTVTDPNNYIVRASSDYPTTWDEIEDKLLKLLGGYIRCRRANGLNVIDYLADYEHTSGQIIEFGKNLLDLDEFITAEDVFTAIIPLGARDENTDKPIDIKSVNNGQDYLIDNTAAGLYDSIIWKAVTWNDVAIPSNLKEKGQALLESSLEMAVTITLSAFDLHLLDVDTDSLFVGDLVRVLSLPHGLDRFFMCSKITLNLLQPGSSQYVFGYTYKTMTEQNRAQIKSAVDAVRSIIEIPPTITVYTRSPSGYLWGDANGDGVVNDADRQAVANYIVEVPVTIHEDAVDFNGNGEIDNADLNRLTSLINNMPAGKIIIKIVTAYSDGSQVTEWSYGDPE